MDDIEEAKLLLKDLQETKVITVSERKLLEASKVFHSSIPHEWKPLDYEYLHAIREALKILIIDGD